MNQIQPHTVSGPWPGVDQCVGAYVFVQQLDPSGGVWCGRQRAGGQSVLLRRVGPTTGTSEDAGADSLVALCRKRKHLVDQMRDHRRVLRWLDVVHVPGGGVWIVCEHPGGQSLEQMLNAREGRFAERLVVGVLAATAAALEGLHGKGLISGRFWPGHVWLPSAGGLQISPLAVIEDLAEDPIRGPERGAYLSPEVWTGQTLDARADIYALGMIGYRMLVGQAGFNRTFGMVMRDGRRAMMRWARWHGNAHLSAPPVCDFDPQVSPRLSELLARMMAKDRGVRVNSAASVVAAVQRHFVAGDHPVTADQALTDRQVVDGQEAQTDSNPTAALPRRRRVGAATIASVSIGTVVAIAALGGSLIGSGGRAHRAAAKPNAQAHEQQRVRAGFSSSMKRVSAALDHGNITAATAELDRWSELAMDGAQRARWQRLEQKLAVNVRAGRIDAALAEARTRANGGHRAQAIAGLKAAAAAFPSPRLAGALARLQRQARIAKAVTQGDAAKAKGRWAAAGRAYRRALQWGGGQTVADKLVAVRGAAALADGKRLMAAQHRWQAIAALSLAASINHGRQARTLLQQVAGKGWVRQLVAAGDRAARIGDWASAVGAYQAAIKAGAGSPVARKLTQAKVSRWLARAARARKADRLADSKKAMASAAALAGETQAVKKAQAAWTRRARYVRDLAAGDRLAKAGAYDTATHDYEMARQAVDTPTVRAKLKAVRYESLMFAARGEMASNRWKVAARLLKAAAAVNDSREVRALQAKVRTKLGSGGAANGS